MKPLRLIYIFAIASVLFGCSKTREKMGKDFQKTARGEADEMVMVIDTAMLNRPVGEELRSLYRSYMVGLPQDEPKFNVHTINPLELNSTLKTAVNMVFVMSLDNDTRQGKSIRKYFTDNSLKLIQKDSSIFMTVRRDEFAKGQLVLYLYAQNEEILLEKIKENRNRLLEVFETAVRERTRAQILKKLEKTAMNGVKDGHGYSLKIPFGWDIAKNLKDFLWIRHLEAQSEYNVFIYERPYSDQDVFNDVGKLRDEITETYLRDSEKPELFITRQYQIPVFTERVSFNGKFAVEARGLWKNSDNSGGGPFVSYTLVDEKKQKLYYIEGYVYSPGTKKIKLVREVEAVLSTFRTPSELED
ncbi:MAG: DUF4837 family protein [Cyclobacteriaceae bacterium]